MSAPTSSLPCPQRASSSLGVSAQNGCLRASSIQSSREEVALLLPTSADASSCDSVAAQSPDQSCVLQRKASRIVCFVVIGAGLVACAAWIGNGASFARSAAVSGPALGRPVDAIAEFDIMRTFGHIFHMLGLDPFKFQCPLPLMPLDEAATRGDPAALIASCCATYENWSVPYQYSECPETCESCSVASPDAKLAQRPIAADFAALAWATAISVEGPPSLSRSSSNAAEVSARPGASAGISAAGSSLEGHSMIATLNYGMRTHDTDLCPRVDDWQVYMLNDNAENIHARVYKSVSSRIAVVAFRGTQADSLKNWEVDVDVATRTMHLDGKGRDTKIHEGFLFAVQRVLPAVRLWINGDSRQSQGAVPFSWKIIFAGHSLGGALATVAATLATLERWHRRPDAVITFGAPRIADGNLSAWWEEKELCDRLLRVNVYNDAVHWTPFAAGFSWWQDLMGCVGSLTSCFGKQTPAADTGALHFSERWQHVCTDSEFLVPGAMRGINSKLLEFSPIGGVLAHFLSNGVFGYGYGVMNSGILLQDKVCGTSPQLFPGFSCTVLDDLVGQRCDGLQMHPDAPDASVCKAMCCKDPWCEVFQFTKTGQCWRGRSNDCRRDTPGAADVIVSQRLH